MGDVIYKELIKDMTWSYSRIETYNDCPYRWYLKYIAKCEPAPMFYSSYGLFMHKILEQFLSGKITKEEARMNFLLNFQKEVRGERPAPDIVEKYVSQGTEYLRNLCPFPLKTVSVEEKVRFELDGVPMVGVIDYIGEKHGELYIIDHKSRAMKPRSGRKRPTAKDTELDSMLKQLYVYSELVKQKFGQYPAWLCFNCFRNNTFIQEPFSEDRLLETTEWVKKSVADIEDEDDFNPYIDFFACKNICDVHDECCYYEGGGSK